MFIEKNSKVLVVVSSLSRTSLASSERAIHLVKTLVSKGIKVSVLTIKDDDIETFNGEVEIYQYLNIKPMFRNKLLNRVLSPFPDSSFLRLWKSKRYILKKLGNDWDIIISSTPPHSINLIAASLVNKSKAKWIIDLRDAWKGNRLHRYGTIFHELISDLTYKIYLNRCNLILANTEKLKDEILRHGIRTEIRTVPNGYPRDYYTARNIHSKYDYLYSGSHYNFKAVKVINSLISQCDSKVKVAFLGDGFGIIDSCYSLGKVSSKAVPNYLFSAKVLVLYLPKEEEGSARILLKAYGYAKSGKPIIYIGPQNATFDFLIKYSNVFQVHEDKPSTMEKALGLIEGKEYDINLAGINSDFSYEKNFEAKLIRS
ncbi:glycosyltransferase [Vibrio sp. Y42_MX_L11]|uniref:glycosyltransferase n=1 Tax=Vibrio sp. Y42_MX_L11 TaxID=2957765 RepID=UPI0020A2A2ED|nr:glycosyltransferase [Vibrio sp. Y42_MX_L11]